MYWHAEAPDPRNPDCLTLRAYDEPDGFPRRLRFTAVGQARILGGGRAYLFGFLARSGRELRARDWVALLRLLAGQYGVSVVEAERRGRQVVISR